ncbi:methyltransferase domain-containing protein [Blastococcus sp. SYSU D00820]
MAIDEYDVVVVGGGAAGLSGALTLARAGRSVLVVDAGEPRNAPAGHVHNYLGREGTPPAELYGIGRAEVTGYGGTVLEGRVLSATRADGRGFAVALDGGRAVHARRLLVTTGLVDRLPDVPGLADRWGRDVLHCPYCHGHEVRGRAIGILATAPGPAVHQALLWRQWSADVVLFVPAAVELSAEQTEQLAARDVVLVPGEVTGLEVRDDRLTGVCLADGTVVARQALVAPPRMEARSEVLASLGLVAEDMEMLGAVIGSRVPAGPMGATDVPGVWVAGNVTDLAAQVVVAAGQGLMAGAAINADLVAEETRRAVEARRSGGHGHGHQHGADDVVHDRAWWEERYRSAPGLWSGRPNDALVEEVTGLPAGRALDAGAGEGGDAIWLAEQGWRVTALDLSAVALERAARAAAERGLADRIEWRQADLTAEELPEAAFDLVTSAFLHPAAEVRDTVLRRLAAAVAPGGTLLVVAHDPSELARGLRQDARPDYFASAAELAALLDPAEWEVQVAEARPRAARQHEQHAAAHVTDAVLRARRLRGASGRP